jgi:hypothetical protein
MQFTEHIRVNDPKKNESTCNESVLVKMEDDDLVPRVFWGNTN